MSHRMKFGTFLAPFHKPGINPTLALEQDLTLVQWLDRCGYDEAWCGEHHSAGTEISARPEIFTAVASQCTRTIKLGTGVVGVCHHNPLFDIAVPAVASPTGPKLAGMHGIGLLSIGATTAAGFDALALHWDVMEAQAAHYKTQVDRNKWRLVGIVHCAETMDQAYRDVEYGMAQWFDYFQAVAAFPQMAVPGSNVKEMIAFVNQSGFGAIGTPDVVNAQIDRLCKQSNGGFGAYLMLAHNWANFDATRKSYDLVARHVFPRWQGQMATQAAADRARASRPELAAIHSAAVEAATQRYAAEAVAGVR